MMQDRLKIRVWDKRKNNYIEDFVFNFINKSPYITVEYFDNEYAYTHTFEEDEIIIEQCTGLKDKNDKLIYEGDIVKDEHDRKYIVKFGKHTVTIPVGYVNGETECLGWYLDNGYLSYHLNPDDDYLTIGNIHENEDLLDNE